MKEKINSQLKETIRRVTNQSFNINQIDEGTPLLNLGINSLSFIELVVEIENEFNISIFEDVVTDYEFINFNILAEKVYNACDN